MPMHPPFFFLEETKIVLLGEFAMAVEEDIGSMCTSARPFDEVQDERELGLHNFWNGTLLKNLGIPAKPESPAWVARNRERRIGVGFVGEGRVG